MFGVSESIYKFVVSGDAAAVVRWTGELTIDADGIACIGEGRKLLLKYDGVLPVIAEIVGVDKLGACPPEHTAEPNTTFVFYLHSHTYVFRIWSAEVAFPGSEVVHMAVVPTHCRLQNIMQLRQSH